MFAVCAFLPEGCAHYHPKPLSAAATASAFERRSLADPGLRRFLEENGQAAKGAGPPGRWGLGQLTYVAFYFQPALAVARAEWALAKAGIVTAGERPNPRLSIVPGVSFNPGGATPWMPAINFDLPIETAGRRGHRLREAKHLSAAARFEIISTAWQVRSRVRAAVVSLVGARQRARLLQAELAAQEEVIRLLEERLKAGAVAATDIMPERLSMLQVLTALGDAKRLQADARVRLAEALGLSARAVGKIAINFDLATAGAGASLDTAAWRRRALLGRGDILAALARYAASESALALEVAKQYPNIDLGTGYQFDQGQHKWTIGISFDLPIFNHNQGPIAQARAKRDLLAAKFLALQASVIAAIDRAEAALAAAKERLAQSKKIVAEQQKIQAATEAAFAAGGKGRLALEIARVETAASELAVLDAELRVQQARGQLEDAIQSPIDARALEHAPKEQR